MAQMWETVFVVNATAQRFPLDMLRYDRCTPYQQQDVDEVWELVAMRPVKGKRYSIKLVAKHGKGWTPTEGRWESFGWQVEKIYAPNRV
jgi:hypothetical protein